jgi:hypothetical protein
MRLGEDLIVLQRTASRLIEIAGIGIALENFNKAPTKSFRVESSFLGKGFQQNQGAISVMSLVPGFFSKVIMICDGNLKSVEATGVKLLEFREIVDPMGAESRCVPDKLTPNGSTKPVFDRNILERTSVSHRRSIVADLNAKRNIVIASKCESRPLGIDQFISGFRLRPWSHWSI